MADPTRLEAGAKAPAIALLDQNGEKVKLADFKGRPVLVYFYPRADTPGCTTQSCGLRDVKDDVGDAVILGISPDLPPKLAKFDEKYGLGFTCSPTPSTPWPTPTASGARRRTTGRPTWGSSGRRSSIGADGKIQEAWYKVSPKDTPTKFLAALGS